MELVLEGVSGTSSSGCAFLNESWLFLALLLLLSREIGNDIPKILALLCSFNLPSYSVVFGRELDMYGLIVCLPIRLLAEIGMLLLALEPARKDMLDGLSAAYMVE
jgi:hypothetical protein